MAEAGNFQVKLGNAPARKGVRVGKCRSDDPGIVKMKFAFMLCAVVLAGCAAEKAQIPQNSFEAAGGRPVPVGQAPAGAKQRPTDEELDRRNRELAGPRLQEGPTLSDGGSGIGDRPAMPVPPSTDPRGR